MRSSPLALLSVVAAGVMFTAGLASCGLYGWHAPAGWVLGTIYVVGIAFGAGLVLTDRNRRSVTKERCFEGVALPISIVLGAVTAAGGAIGVAFAIDQGVRPLFLASCIAALWMTTYPFHPLIVWRLLARNIVFGIDAVSLGGAIVRYSDVRSVTNDGRTLVLETATGKTKRRQLASLADAERVSLKLAELAKGVAPSASLRREGRSLDAWRNALVSPDYRSNVVTTDEAARVLTASSATTEERLGAAIVLGRAGEAPRIREAAAQCLEPRVRIALERVADETLDDGVLEAALRER